MYKRLQNLGHGCRTIYAGLPSLVCGWRMVVVRLSGFCGALLANLRGRLLGKPASKDSSAARDRISSLQYGLPNRNPAVGNHPASLLQQSGSNWKTCMCAYRHVLRCGVTICCGKRVAACRPCPPAHGHGRQQLAGELPMRHGGTGGEGGDPASACAFNAQEIVLLRR